MNIRSVGELLTRSILGIRTGSCASQNLTAPSIPVIVDDGKFNPHALVGTIDFNLNYPSTLVWSLHDHAGQLVYQSTDYELSDDGLKATFAHTFFPEVTDGERVTITQDVLISSS